MSQSLYNFVRRWFPLHAHSIHIEDIAIHKGKNDFAGVPIVAWRWKCKWCGATIDELSISGIDQLRDGENIDEILEWMRDGKKDT